MPVTAEQIANAARELKAAKDALSKAIRATERRKKELQSEIDNLSIGKELDAERAAQKKLDDLLERAASFEEGDSNENNS